VTISSWLEARSAAPPPRLAARIAETLGADGESPSAQIPERCVDAADSLLRDLLGRGSSGRDLALDLLTVDALVTYAFEAASDEPAALMARADRAMRRLAAAAVE
jgi:hypothetical protein